MSTMFQVPPSTNTHPMVTRSKDGIFKPKALIAQAISDQSKSVVKLDKKATSSPKPDYPLTEPPSFKIATQFSQWRSAMDDEFAALQK